MGAIEKNVENKPARAKYQAPAMRKYDPVKIIQGSGNPDSLYDEILLYYTP